MKAKAIMRARTITIFPSYRHRIMGVQPVIMWKDDNYKCIKCGSKKNIIVHHKLYSIDITINDLEVLCRSCHKKEHNKEK